MATTHGESTDSSVSDSIESLRLVAPGHKDDAIWKLEVMSRRGRLPGFRRVVGGFSVAAHGNPFDKTLTMMAVEDGGGGGSDGASVGGAGGGVVFRPELRIERRMPAIALVIFVLTVFPGVLLTDSFLRMHLEFYEKWTTEGLVTWWWYVPLTVVSLVWAWFGAMKKSTKTAGASAREAIDKIAGELDGQVESRSS